MPPKPPTHACMKWTKVASYSAVVQIFHSVGKAVSISAQKYEDFLFLTVTDRYTESV